MLRRLLATLRGTGAATAAVDGPAVERIRLSSGWVRHRRATPVLYSSPGIEALQEIRRLHPARVDETIQVAERILRHEFDLLGSGPFKPADPDRKARGTYTPIDWYLDPVRHLRFPRGIPHKEWKLYEMRPGNADIKYPWELARCQHWAVLGQAFAFTRDERFAQEIGNELDDFVEANPVGIGVNWTCTMDVAIRALNWAIGFELIRASATLDDAFWMRAYAALHDTGAFTRSNLENTYEVTSNHFLSNVVGLWFLGAVFDDLPSGQEWLTFARGALEQEMKTQVLPDGADYESSVPYHRLVAELFLGSSRLADVRGAPLSESYRGRVHDMIEFLVSATRPDGMMPQVGDADDGRLHIFTAAGTPQDPRHLFGPAAAMFKEPEWASLGGDAGAWEAAWWGLAPMPPSAERSTRSRLFPDAGLAVMRADAHHYLLVTNGIVGTKGFGNHKHNDQLSFEYHHGGVPLIVDPGSFVYTSDFDARNLFRSTASHNTLFVDTVEQNEMRPEWIFRLFESSNAEHILFDEDSDAIRYAGRHHGYERLPEAVTHEREFRLKKADGTLEFTDRLDGRGAHQLRWHFHLSPGVEAAEAGDAGIELRARGRRWLLRMPQSLERSIDEGQYSPSYGVAVPCRVVNATAHVVLDGSRSWTFTITP
jgi:uncharacterized heparinase superfamily protein